MPPTCCPKLLGACINWGARDSRSRQPGASTFSLKTGNSSISLFRSCASWEWSCLDSIRKSSLGSPKAFPRSGMIPLTRVGGYRPGQDGELRPEVAVHPFYKLVPQGSGEVQVDVGESGHILGDEPFQGETPAQWVDVA